MEDGRAEVNRGNPLIMGAVVVVVLLALVAMAQPVTMSNQRKAAITETTSNAKQVFYLLVEFDQDYGEFPSDATAVDELAGYQGKYANDYLAQLIENGYTRSEEIFYARGGGVNKRPDNDITGKEDQLSEGECGFAYVKGLSSSSNPKTPVLAAAMYGDGFKFNTDVYRQKAVVLHVDGRVRQLLIDRKTRHAKVGKGKTLFESGPGTPWEAKPFDPATLCYAKKPYAFTPKLIHNDQLKDCVFGGFSVIAIGSLLSAAVISRMRAGKNASCQNKKAQS